MLGVRADRDAAFYGALARSFAARHATWWIAATGEAAVATSCAVVADLPVVGVVVGLRRGAVRLRWTVTATPRVRAAPSVGFYVSAAHRRPLDEQAASLAELLAAFRSVRLSACGSAIDAAFRLAAGLRVVDVSVRRETSTIPHAQPQLFVNVVVTRGSNSIPRRER